MDGTKLSKTMVEVGFNDVDQIESSYFDSLFLDTKWFKTMIIKGCQLKNVPTGQTTAAYISERTRNSK